MVVIFFSDLLWAITNYWVVAYLEPYRTSMKDHFWENNERPKDVNYYCKNAPSQMLDWVLNTPLIGKVLYMWGEGGLCEHGICSRSFVHMEVLGLDQTVGDLTSGNWDTMFAVIRLRATAIIFIKFWDFLMFYRSLFSAQVKRCSITTYKHGIYELPQELPNNLRFRILVN